MGDGSGTWSFRGRGVSRDRHLQHMVVKAPEYAGGPEPCETCRCPVVYMRKHGDTTGPVSMFRASSSIHEIHRGITALPDAPGHIRCWVGYTAHTREDCEAMAGDGGVFSVSFVAATGSPMDITGRAIARTAKEAHR